MKKLLPLLIVAAALLFWRPWKGTDGGADQPASPTASVASPVAPAPEVVLAAALEVAPGSAVPGRSPAEVVLAATVEASAPEPAALILQGTATAVDDLGGTWSDLDGSFMGYLDLIADDVEVSIEGGRWSLELPAEVAAAGQPGELELWELTLGERTLVPEPRSYVVRAGALVELVGYQTVATLLHVRDAATGAELSAVDIAYAHVDMQPTEGDELSLSGEPSPLHFVPDFWLVNGDRQSSWWVGAPGYEWAKVTVSHRESVERTVELGRAGSLEVRLLGTPPKSANVELTRLGGPLGNFVLREIWVAGRASVEVDRLSPGPWRVDVTWGEEIRQRTSLITGEVEIRAGERAVLELELPATPQRPDYVRLAGSLRIHPAWSELGRLRLNAGPASEMPHGPWQKGAAPGFLRGMTAVDTLQRGDADSDHWRWDAGEVLAGPVAFEVAVDGCGTIHHEIRELGLAGDEEVVLEVPEPARLVLTLFEEGSGKNLLAGLENLWDAGLSLGFDVPGARSNISGALGELDPERGCYLTVMPQGEVVISIDSDAHGWLYESVELSPGLNELSFDLAPLLFIEVSVESEGLPVPLGDEWVWSVVLLDSSGDELGGGMESLEDRPGRVRFSVSDVGRVTLVLPEINGYEPPGAVEVDLVPGVVAEVLVDLVPR